MDHYYHHHQHHSPSIYLPQSVSQVCAAWVVFVAHRLFTKVIKSAAASTMLYIPWVYICMFVCICVCSGTYVKCIVCIYIKHKHIVLSSGTIMYSRVLFCFAVMIVPPFETLPFVVLLNRISQSFWWLTYKPISTVSVMLRKIWAMTLYNNNFVTIQVQICLFKMSNVATQNQGTWWKLCKQMV